VNTPAREGSGAATHAARSDSPAGYAPLLVAITALALVVRIYALGRQSLWMDEALTATIAAHPLATLLFDPKVDVNFPPLHNMVSHLVRRWLGSGETWLRLPSALAGALTAPLLYAVARRPAGPRAALLGALLFAVSPFHVWYGQEARPYALLLMFGLLTAWCTLRFLERPASHIWLMGGVLAGVATFYTHIIAGPVLLALGGYLVVTASPVHRAKALGAALALGVLLLPQVVRFASAPPTVTANANYHFQLEHLGYTFWAFGTGYSLGPSLLELREGMVGVRPYVGLILPLLGGLLLLAVIGGRRLWCTQRRGWWFCAAWIGVPIGSAVLGALLTAHPYNVRYAMLAAPGFLVLCAVGVTALPWRWSRYAAALILLVVQGTALFNYYTVPKYAREDNRAAVRFLNAGALPGEVLLVSAGYTTLPLRYYGLREELEVMPYPQRGMATREGVARDLGAVVGSRPRVWVFLSRTFHSDPGGEIVKYLDSRLTLVREFRAAGVQVLLFSNPVLR
jgi:mannosyltransferase